LIAINVNGETDVSKIKKHTAFSLFSKEQKEVLIRREIR
jgi:hypothetical protein